MNDPYYFLRVQGDDGAWFDRGFFHENERERAKGAARVDGGGDHNRIFYVLPDGTEGA